MSDWIDTLAAKDQLTKAEAEARAQREITASFVLSEKAPDFWESLVANLRSDCANLGKLNISATVGEYGNGPESQLRITARLNGVLPQMTYADIFYRKSSGVIHCHPEIGRDERFCLGARNDGKNEWSVGAYRESGSGWLMDSKQIAREIIEPMVKIVRGDK